MDGLIQKRTEPRPEVSTPIVKHDKPFGGDTLTRDINKSDAREDSMNVSHEESIRRNFEKAKAELGRMNYAQTMDFLQAMPVGVLEMYLLAEEVTQNREEVLRYFPKPGTKARSRWLPEMPAPVGAEGGEGE